MILKKGSKSNSKQAVRALSLLLLHKKKDEYDKELKKAVENKQKEIGVKVDGIAGPVTLSKIVPSLPNVNYGDKSESIFVKAVQALVGTSIDGKYGKNTRSNVIAFQIAAELEQTGNITLNDWKALWDLPYTKNDKKSSSTVTTGTNTKQPVDYKQGDSRWGKKPYTTTGNKKQTIASSGCGPTSMADIMATWINSKMTPVDTCEYSLKHGYRTPNSGTAWGFFKSIFSSYAKTKIPNGFTNFLQTKSMATAREAIRSGALVVSSMGPGYWTKGGHYICLWKTDDTYMYANDPASKTRKKQKLAKFEKERKQFFIFYR